MYVADRLTLKEYLDPFTGAPVNKGKIAAFLGAAGEHYTVGKSFNAPSYATGALLGTVKITQ